MPRSFMCCKYFTSLLRHHDRMLKMSGKSAVCRANTPPVIINKNMKIAGNHHRLDRDRHAGCKLHPGTLFPEIQYHRLLMYRIPDAMPRKIAHHRKSVFFYILLYRMTDIPDPRIRSHYSKTFGKRVTCHSD